MGQRRHRQAPGLGLLYSQERTSAMANAMSALGQEVRAPSRVVPDEPSTVLFGV
jgi:hypothetical protein